MTLDVTAFTGLGAGIHDVNVTGLERKVAKAGGDYLRWEFADREGHTTSANSSVEMTPGNKTGKWFAALTGRPTVVGESRQMAEVIGRPCTIVIELNAEGYPKILALTARQADPRVVPSFAQTNTVNQETAQPLNAAETAQQQHAIQEGDELPF